MSDMAFEIYLARSGLTLVVPETKSILEVLQENGVYVPTSCETGVCGTCLTPLLDGVPDHRDEYQMDDEKAANTHIALCISRAVTDRLVLDL
jgi:vanillate O-demethylase ferredoxin subunit